MLRALIAFCVSVFVAQGAQAAAVTNLADEAQTIEIADGNAWKQVTIAHWETWRSPFDVKVRYRGREFMMHFYEDYAIWKDGTMGPQRTMYSAGGLN